jgi:hypothetical protein
VIEKYREALERKRARVLATGIHSPPELNESLFDFQSAVTKWAIKRGRAALFLDTGLGKSRCAIEWARVVSEHTGKPVLILTPLAVAAQFVSEGASIGVVVNHIKTRSCAVRDGVNVINYDRLDHVDDTDFGGVVLDESSILKDFNGKTRNALIERFKGTRFKLCTTATPAPNDHTELGNHAEFLGVMTRTEMLSMFFVHDADTTQDWRLKGHAVADFWEWVASWACAIRSPSDIGFDASKYQLPPLTIEQVTVENSRSLGSESGQLIGYEARTLTEQREARRDSLSSRVQACSDMVNGSPDPWLVWCDLNDESSALASAIPDAVEVRGSDSNEKKEAAVWGFIRGEHRVLVTKPSICGMGLNMQRCANVAFVGLGYSWELYYQAIRRVYRFGQTRPVNVKVIVGSAEGRVVDAIKRKQSDADAMAAGMVKAMSESMNREIRGAVSTRDEYNAKEEMRVPSWLK